MDRSNIHRNGSSPRVRALLLAASAAPESLMSNEAGNREVEVMVSRPTSESEFTQAMTTLRPDVVIADSALETVPPSRVLELVRGAGLSTPIIVVSDSFDEQSAVEWMRAGAEDLVLWSHLHRLRPAIHEALSVREPLSRLSPRQREVMQLVALGLTMREIAERLGLSVKTVETHRSAVAKRLGIRDVARLVRYAVRVGMVA